MAGPLDSLGEARTLKSLVAAYGQQLPPAQILIERGLRFLVEAPVLPQVAGPAEEPTPVAVTFRDFAVKYVDGW